MGSKLSVGVDERGADEGVEFKTGFCRGRVKGGGGFGGADSGSRTESEGESETARSKAGVEHESEVRQRGGGEGGVGESTNEGVEEMRRRERGRKVVEEREGVGDATEGSGGGDDGSRGGRGAGEEAEAEEMGMDLPQVEKGASGVDEGDEDGRRSCDGGDERLSRLELGRREGGRRRYLVFKTRDFRIHRSASLA